jgi:hypothetical protein
MRKFLLNLGIAAFLMGSTGCLGSFQLFNNLKDWNHEATDDKWLNELIFLGLNIIPVYGLAFLGDAIIFNTIEFWTDENPIGMKDGEEKSKIVESDGKTYKITTKKDQINIEEINLEGNTEDGASILFDRSDMMWKIHSNGETKNAIKVLPNRMQFDVYLDNHQYVTINAFDSDQEMYNKICKKDIALIE